MLDWTLISLQIWPFVYPSEEVNVSLFAMAAYFSYFPLFKEGFSAKVVWHQLPTDFLKQRQLGAEQFQVLQPPLTKLLSLKVTSLF